LTASTPVVEVVQGEVRGLQLGAHRVVADHHTLRQGIEQIGVVAVFVRGSHPNKHSGPMQINQCVTGL
jgi:predicted ABC-class ATPase